MPWVIPSKVFHCCLLKYQTAFTLDSEAREMRWEGGRSEKEGRFQGGAHSVTLGTPKSP